MPENGGHNYQRLFNFKIREVGDRFGLPEFEKLIDETCPHQRPSLLIVHQKGRKKVYFATDPEGMYPFFFHVFREGILFASSLPEICRRSPGLQFSREWLEEYFSGRTDYSKCAVFQDVKLTLGRCIYELDYGARPASLKVHERRTAVWKFSESDRLNIDDVARAVKERVFERIMAAVESEERVALLFSGGADSLFIG